MKTFFADYYYTAAHSLEFAIGLNRNDPKNSVQFQPIKESNDLFQTTYTYVNSIKEYCERDGFSSALDQCNFILNQMNTNNFYSKGECLSHLDDLKRRIEFDMKNHYFFLMNQGEKNTFDNPAPFGLEIQEHFPSLQYDITESAKCYVLERYTAAVFHTMRALEILHQELGNYFKVEPTNREGEIISITEADWGKLLSLVEGKIQGLQSGKSGKLTQAERNELAEFKNILYPLSTIKKTVRDYCMHGRTQYDKPLANVIIEDSRYSATVIARFIIKQNPHPTS